MRRGRAEMGESLDDWAAPASTLLLVAQPADGRSRGVSDSDQQLVEEAGQCRGLGVGQAVQRVDEHVLASGEHGRRQLAPGSGRGESH